MGHELRNATNQRQGGAFEAALTWEAVRAGVLCVRNGQNVKWTRGGRMVAVKSNLDWTLLKKGDVPCFADTKSVAGRRIAKSALAPHQMELVLRYRDFGARSGFIVHLRELNAVMFYPAELFKAAHERQGLGVDDGVLLGRLQAFDVAKLWRSP